MQSRPKKRAAPVLATLGAAGAWKRDYIARQNAVSFLHFKDSIFLGFVQDTNSRKKAQLFSYMPAVKPMDAILWHAEVGGRCRPH